MMLAGKQHVSYVTSIQWVLQKLREKGHDFVLIEGAPRGTICQDFVAICPLRLEISLSHYRFSRLFTVFLLSKCGGKLILFLFAPGTFPFIFS